MVPQLIAETRQRMEKTIDDLSRELASVRTGRASVHLLDQVTVDYYGTATPVNQVATVHAPEPSLLTVQPWDMSQIAAIEKAVLTSALGLNPSNDGKLIRIPIPPLTAERRQVLAKQVGRIAEDHRTAVRNIRRAANDRLKTADKAREISKDEEYRGHKEVQEVTDEFIGRIDDLAARKEKEILEV
jgi:ribosome recycling factor